MKLLITSALLFLALTPSAQAHHYNSDSNSNQHSRGEFKAKVVNYTPVYRYVTTRPPQTYCKPIRAHNTHSQYYGGKTHNKSTAIAGGIVGGLIGHAASEHQHKGLGTIIGAVIGSSLVHNSERTNKNDSRYDQVQQQNCVTTYKKAQKVRILDGYRVTYRSQGEMYRTFRKNKPAKHSY